jgi:hypothetical protein
MAEEPENLTLQLLRRLDSKLDATNERIDKLATNERIDKLAMAVTLDVRDLRAESVASEKRLVDNLAELRRVVIFYHASVAGHGVLLTELAERIRHPESLMGVQRTPQN